MNRTNQRVEDGLADITAALVEALNGAGIRHAVSPIGIAESLWEEVSAAHEQGLLADDLYDAYQEYWRFVPPVGMEQPRTLIAVAWRSPLARIRFAMEAGSLEAVVPPTYISSAGRIRCLDTVRSVLQPAGYRVDWARVPAKLLAAHTGLARYGRNNITYVDGLGSYVRLGALCTDADLVNTAEDADAGANSAVQAGLGVRRGTESARLAAAHVFMEECGKCRACSRACPTGCIPEEGTVINAAHCLSQANENEGAWPSWVPVDGHNSLVGCMRCQEVCPVNRTRADREPELVAEFDRVETAMILEGLPAEQLPDGLRDKLVALDLDEYSTVLGRNLRALQQSA